MKHAKIALMLGLIGLLAACAGPNTAEGIPGLDGDIAGFWAGLIHGFFAPFSFVISLFSSNVQMYEVHNNGAFYDLGFVLGAGVLFLVLESEREKKPDPENKPEPK